MTLANIPLELENDLFLRITIAELTVTSQVNMKGRAN